MCFVFWLRTNPPMVLRVLMLHHSYRYQAKCSKIDIHAQRFTRIHGTLKYRDEITDVVGWIQASLLNVLCDLCISLFPPLWPWGWLKTYGEGMASRDSHWDAQKQDCQQRVRMFPVLSWCHCPPEQMQREPFRVSFPSSLHPFSFLQLLLLFLPILHPTSSPNVLGWEGGQ